MLRGTALPSGASGVSAGEGDAARPYGFQGTLTVTASILSGTVKVISLHHTVWAQLPLIPGYHTIDPHAYGFGDPGQLLDPANGLSSLLVTPSSAAYDGQVRVSGTVLNRVKAQLPGPVVARLLTSADESRPVSAEIGIDPTTAQIRQVVLTGPFFSKTTPSTYTLTLSKYGESVTIRAPG